MAQMPKCSLIKGPYKPTQYEGTVPSTLQLLYIQVCLYQTHFRLGCFQQKYDFNKSIMFTIYVLQDEKGDQKVTKVPSIW